MKKHFNKNLIMSEKEEQFQSSNACWICEKRIDNDDENVRDHCHVTGTFRGAAHWDCNINLQLTKKVSVIFHNLRCYDSHSILRDFNKFDVRIDVILNGLEKYMVFFLNKSLVFNDSMRFMKSSLDKLAKNLSDDDFTKECGSENLELLKQKGAHPYEYMNSFERFDDKKLPNKKCFHSSTKDGRTDHDGKKWDGHIRLFGIGKKIAMYFASKIWVIITIIIWKKMFCYYLMFLKSLLTHVRNSTTLVNSLMNITID